VALNSELNSDSKFTLKTHVKRRKMSVWNNSFSSQSLGSVKSSADKALDVCGVSLERTVLAKLRLKAQRCKAWFRLKRIERSLMDLVISVVEKVRNLSLAKILEPVVKRLLGAIENKRDVMVTFAGRIAYWMRTNGLSLAQELSRIAEDWGNKSAVTWPKDDGFIKYLTIMNMGENKLL
jgi:hypothetical protein